MEQFSSNLRDREKQRDPVYKFEIYDGPAWKKFMLQDTNIGKAPGIMPTIYYIFNEGWPSF
jgi:hypothetical protein